MFFDKSFKNDKIIWMKVYSVNSFPFFLHFQPLHRHLCSWTTNPVVLWIDPRTSCVLGKHFPTEFVPSQHSRTSKRSKLDFVPTVAHLCDELISMKFFLISFWALPSHWGVRNPGCRLCNDPVTSWTHFIDTQGDPIKDNLTAYWNCNPECEI